MSVSENLFQAIDTIISQRINEVSFDRTLICEIVSDSQHEKGEYTVKQDARKFVAYASGTERYRVGQQVYVTIPQGNYDLKKVIIGRYSADDINPHQYSSPMDAMLVMEVFDKFEDSFDSLMVAPSSVDKTFAEDSLVTLENDIIPPPANQEQEFGKLHYFGFEGVFTTTLESTEGNYGVTIHFNENEQPDLVFDSSEFLGNPYWFDGGFKVQKIFDYDLSNVTSVRVKLYQGGNFNNLSEAESNIILSNVKLYFGYDQKEFAAAVKGSEKVFTIVEEKLAKQEYYGGQDNDIKISAIYITKQGERYVREEIPAGVTWYRFYNGSEDFGAGNGWAKILDQSAGTLTNDQVWTIQLKQEGEEVSTTTEFPEVLNRTERICAMYEGTLSNVLEYILAASQTAGNEQAGAGNPNLPSITVGLINDDYNGIYNLYGNDNKLIPRTLAARTLEASYDNKVEWGQNGETVTWEFPAIGSMIKAPDLGTLNGYDDEGNPQTSPWSVETIKDLDEQPIKYLVTWIKEADIEGSRRIQFQLADSYLPNYTNNTIKCITTTGQTKQWGEKQLLFGLANTVGSGYAFNINLDKQILVPDGKIIASVTLQDSTGRYITDKIDPTSVVWSWNQRGQDANTLTGFQIKPKLPTDVELKEEEAQGKSSVIEANINDSLYEVGRTTYTVFSTGDNGIAKVEEWKDTYAQPEGLSIDDWNNYIQSVNADYRKICYCKEIEIYGKVEDGNRPIDLLTYCNMNILQAELNWSTEGINNNINLTNYVTIPCTTGKTDVLMTGATRVVYATSGLESSYSKDPYQLLVEEKVLLPTGNTLLGRKGAETKNLPKLISSPNQNSVLRILQPIQPKPTNPEPCYVEFRDDDNHIWQYPILITQNAYASDLLNAWDGSLKIDTEGNSILSALMGAGEKDSENRFTGVLIGAIGNTIQNAKTGLYGLQNGKRVFELNEEGEFYVGDGDNYLELKNGNMTISLNNEFKLEAGNLIINKDVGIVLRGRGENSIAVHLNPDGISTIGGFNIADDYLYRRGTDSEGKYNTMGTGMAARGSNDDYMAFWAGYHGTSSPSPVGVGPGAANDTNFYVTNGGKMFAKAGEIAGWNIAPGKLYAGDTANGLGLVLQTAPGTTWAIAAGSKSHSSYASAKFRVSHEGKFYAESGSITGDFTIGGSVKIGGASLTASNIDTFIKVAKGDTTSTDWNVKHIEADSGSIGGWTIGKDLDIDRGGGIPSIKADAIYHIDRAAGTHVYLTPSTIYTYSADAGNDYQQIDWYQVATILSSTNGFTGSLQIGNYILKFKEGRLLKDGI